MIPPRQRPSTASLRAGAPRPALPLDESGISLAEVMVAMVIFTVGALGLGATIPLGMNRVTDSASGARASTLAAERCEDLLSTPYGDLDLDAGAHEDAQNPRDGLYDVHWNVEADQPLTDCKRVTVTVQRSGAAGTLVRLVIVVPRAAS